MYYPSFHTSIPVCLSYPIQPSSPSIILIVSASLLQSFVSPVLEFEIFITNVDYVVLVAKYPSYPCFTSTIVMMPALENKQLSHIDRLTEKRLLQGFAIDMCNRVQRLSGWVETDRSKTKSLGGDQQSSGRQGSRPVIDMPPKRSQTYNLAKVSVLERTTTRLEGDSMDVLLEVTSFVSVQRRLYPPTSESSTTPVSPTMNNAML
ncbi:hypothetical protein L6452_11303 [Arctium lappa]|uniref:Uncharacterized protein n=1 Tax=Arctium lappa TaxID=4217 RepID=A0ACB9DPA2_ARCLA|nr:hypothetical protein L6452_11303 [Arctium lappa]